MLKRTRVYSAFALIIPALLCQPLISLAQNPVKDAARDAKVTPDLFTIITNNGAPAQVGGRGLEIKNSYVIIDNAIAIEAISTDGDGRDLLPRLQALGLRNGVWFGRMVSGYLPIDKISELKNVPGLRFARPAYEPQHNSGAVTSQGDRAIGSNVARQTYGVTGAGSKVGILSDSYNKLGGAAAGVQSGDLPSGVQVLADFLQPSATDEGRAMAEIIHDVAPGAGIAFHTAQGGQAAFARGIKALAAAGCNIIVDDIIYFAEPFFQDGVVAQAADEVVATNNVSYFTAAGNQARSSYQAGFRNSGVTVPNYGQAHDFGGGDTRQRITIPAGGNFQMALQWDDPFFSAGGSGAQSDLDILIYLADGTLVSGSFGDNIANGDPFEYAGFINTAGSPLFIDVVIVKIAGPDPGLIKWINFGSWTVTIEHDTRSSSSRGHSNSAGAISVGAAGYSNTPTFNPGLTMAVIEEFSSAGGTPILFTTQGERINGTTGIIRQKPDITAVDGGNTTFFFPGQDTESDGFPNFFGTSAAAPHAAAVAALMQQRAGNGLSPGRIRSVMQSTALDMDDPLTPGFDAGFDFRTGSGFLRADRAVQAVQAAGQPLALVPPDYNCATGQLTFRTTGSNGSPVEYRSTGITDWTANPVQFIDAPVQADLNSTTVYLQARQNGVETAYSFNFRAYCQSINANQPPVVTNAIGTQVARQGSFFAFQIPSATFSDPNGDALTYSATGLPNGLTFDPASRQVAGTPGQTGTFPVTITATDPGSLSVRSVFSLLVSPATGAQPLTLIAPIYNCQTGGITLRTVGGDGTTITYTAVGVRRDALTDPTGVVETELRGDPNPIAITATQGGLTVSYRFDFAASCSGNVQPSPPAQPTATFALTDPTYDCATGVFTFRAVNAAPGNVIEYYSVPGITHWSTNPTHFFNYDLRTAGDVKPFTLRARYVNEPASEVTLEWVRPAPCSPGARTAAFGEPGGELRVTVLGNPTRDEQVEIDVTGGGQQRLHLRVSNGRGEWISEQTVDVTGDATRRQRVSIGRSPGIYLLQIGTNTERKTVKIVRQ